MKHSLKSILNRSCTYITFSEHSPKPYHNCKQLPQSPQDYLFVGDIWLSPRARTAALARHRTSPLGSDIKKQIVSPHQSSGWVRASCWQPASTTHRNAVKFEPSVHLGSQMDFLTASEWLLSESLLLRRSIGSTAKVRVERCRFLNEIAF